MKYKLTEEFIEVYGTKLYRIECITPFGIIKAGDKGGYIEREENLNQSGNAWVSGDARVFGDAEVSGNAWVSGDARVYGNARVSGDAEVYGDTEVSGNAWVYGDAEVYGNARVSGDARVFGDAEVSGDAEVYGDAEVSGNARVSGNAWVSGDARVYGDYDILVISPIGSRKSALTICRQKDGSIKYATGCFYGTRDEFFTKVQSTHKDTHHYTAYMAAIEFADKFFTF